MLAEFRRLFSRAGAYSLGSMAWQAATIILLPINLHFLRPEDYGGLTVVALAGSLVQAVGQMGFPSAVFQHYAECRARSDTAGARQVLFTGLVAQLSTMSLVSAAGWLLAGRFAGWALTPAWAPLLRLTLLALALAGLRALVMYLLQAEEKAGLYLVFSLLELCLTLGLNLALVAGLRFGAAGVVLAALAVQSIMFAVSLPLLVARLPRRWDFSLRALRRALRYGLPLMPAQVGQILSNQADRGMLARLGTLAMAGVYDVGYKLGALQDIIVASPLNQAWLPYFVNRAEAPEIRRIHARVVTYASAGGMLLALGLGTQARPLLQLIVRNPAYWAGADVVFIVAVAYIFKGLNSVVGSPMLVLGRTEFNLVWWLVTTVANIGLNLLLIPRFGLLGAAWATLLAFALALVVNWAVVSHYHPVAYEFGRLGRVMLGGAAAYWLVLQIQVPSLWALFFIRGLACLSGYPLLLVLSGFVTADEWQALERRLRASPLQRFMGRKA